MMSLPELDEIEFRPNDVMNISVLGKQVVLSQGLDLNMRQKK
jgi:hypothetical protein